MRWSRIRGANDAEVYVENGEEFSVHVRNGSIESLKQSSFQGLGLRVFLGNKTGFSFTTDFSKPALESIIDSACAWAYLSDADENNVLPNAVLSQSDDLGLFDSHVQDVSPDTKIILAKSLEKKASERDSRITHTEGASFTNTTSFIHILNSKGSSGSYATTLSGMSVSPVAEWAGIRTNETWYSYDRFFDKLDSPDNIAAIAVERTVRLLGARKIQTTRADVILEPSCGVTFLSSFFSVINGDHVNRELSFLRDDIEKKIAPDFLTIIDDGSLRGKLGSRPFDGEGVLTSRQVVVENGILKKFLYDTKAALRAGTVSTGHAHRRYDSEITIGAHNLFVEKGNQTSEEIIQKTERGLLITKLMGFGFDPVSGVFSYGASGLWIDHGSPVYPVHEIVVASNMKDMLKNILSVGNDLEFRGPVACPTLKIADMTISGN
ncbi:TldD/PmbA family protein [bacterium]|nr:TldD/PmbA family protein [bacterium]